MRGSAIKSTSAQIIASDSEFTIEIAARLIKRPALFDRFTSQHPDWQPRDL